jgi:hypothetical protein
METNFRGVISLDGNPLHSQIQEVFMMAKKVAFFNDFLKSLGEIPSEAFIKDKKPVKKETIIRELKEIIQSLDLNQSKLMLGLAKTLSNVGDKKVH